MAEDDQADKAAGKLKLSPEGVMELTSSILEDLVYDIVFSTSLSCHRSEKMLRMQSAATQAESIALMNLEPSQKSQSAPTAETEAAKYENGRVFLKGNPLKTTPDITCPHCKLPRLMHPIMGKGMQEPDRTKEYCKLYPWVQRSGHDVYGNPFPTDQVKSKKERELLKKAEKENVGTPGSQDTDMGNDVKPLSTGGKPASYIPWHTCPNCKRSLLITRFAQHLEKCLGISGRQSSRNAMAKISGQNGNGNGSGMGNTPLGSRMGTPAPGSQDNEPPKSKSKLKGSPTKKGDDDDEDGENETPEKKKKPKKSSYIKKGDRANQGNILKVKLKPPGSAKMERKDSESSIMSEKREREETEDPAPKAKKLKLSVSKVDSGSAPASAEPASAQD